MLIIEVQFKKLKIKFTFVDLYDQEEGGPKYTVLRKYCVMDIFFV